MGRKNRRRSRRDRDPAVAVAATLAPRSVPSDPGESSSPLTALYASRPISGVQVTQQTALTYAAFWACVRVVSEDLASLPLRVHRRRPGGGSDELPSNPADWLCHVQANPETPAFTFRETLLAHTLTWGNGYAEIERDAIGRPLWLWQLTPDRVLPYRAEDGRLWYSVRNSNEPNTEIPAEDMIHVKGLGFDGLIGYSVVSTFARTIGTAIGTDEAAARYFANDSTPGGLLKYPGRLSELAKKNLRETWAATHGGPSNRRTLAILEEGLAWEQTGIPPEDSQLLQNRQIGPTEMARIFRVPPHKIAELARATFSNIESQEISYVNDCLVAWAVRLEQELNAKLFGRNSQGVIYLKHNFKGRLRGDAAARAAFYTQMLDRGVFSINDVLDKEDMNPIGPDGDKRFVPLNMQLLEKAGEEPPAPDPAPEPPPPDEQAPDTEPDEEGPEMTAWRMILAEGCGRVDRRRKHREEDALRRGVEFDIAEHDGYTRQTLAPVLDAVAAGMGCPDAGRIVAVAATAFDPDRLLAMLRAAVAAGKVNRNGSL